MKSRIFLVGAAFAAGVTLLVGLAGVDYEPTPDGSDCRSVTLTLKAGSLSGPWTWTAMRALDDGGTAKAIQSQSESIDSLVSVAVRIDLLCENPRGAGTFILRRILRSRELNDAGQLRREGTWSILEGTGVYAGLRGKGTIVGYSGDGLVVDTLTGVVWTENRIPSPPIRNSNDLADSAETAN